MLDSLQYGSREVNIVAIVNTLEQEIQGLPVSDRGVANSFVGSRTVDVGQGPAAAAPHGSVNSRRLTNAVVPPGNDEQ